MKKIAILGSGVVGAALAKGFLERGDAVMRASREPKKLEEWKAGVKGEASVGTFADAAKWGDVVVLCIKGTVAEALVKELAGSLAGKVVIDATNPIADEPPNAGVVRYFTKQNESLMELLQAAAPQAKLVKAFNSVGNMFMVNPPFKPMPTMFICGNDDGAKRDVTEILTSFGWHTADMGAVEVARPIEALCQLWCARGIAKNDWPHALRWLDL